MNKRHKMWTVRTRNVQIKTLHTAATQICDRNTGIRIYQKVLTAHSTEGKVDSHVTNRIFKQSRTYQSSHRKYWLKIRAHTSQAVTAGGCKPDDWTGEKFTEPPTRELTSADVASSKRKPHKLTLLTVYRVQLIGDTLPHVKIVVFRICAERRSRWAC